jgi:hypothetical protein
MPDRIITVHISPYISAQGTAEDLVRWGISADQQIGSQRMQNASIDADRQTNAGIGEARHG